MNYNSEAVVLVNIMKPYGIQVLTKVVYLTESSTKQKSTAQVIIQIKLQRQSKRAQHLTQLMTLQLQVIHLRAGITSSQHSVQAQ